MKATDDILWRKNPAAAAQISKEAQAATSAAINKALRQATFILSTSAVDRYGDTIDQDGWELDNFKSNPVVLCNHNSWSLPIGKCVSVGVEEGVLKGTVQFASTKDAEDVWTLVQEGVLRATSVGFKPKEYTEDAERKGSWGWPCLNFKKQELLEWSVVGIPANPECVLDDQAKACLERVVRSMTGAPAQAPRPTQTRSVPVPVRKGASNEMSKAFAKHFEQAEKSMAACRALHEGKEPDGDEQDPPEPPADDTEKDDPPADPPADKAFDAMTQAELVETLKGPRGDELRQIMAERAATLKRKQAGKLD